MCMCVYWNTSVVSRTVPEMLPKSFMGEDFANDKNKLKFTFVGEQTHSL